MSEFSAKLSHKCIHFLIVLSIICVPLFYVYGKGDNYFFSIYDIYKVVLIQSFSLLLLACYLIKFLSIPNFQIRKTWLYFPLALFFIMMLISLTQAMNMHEALMFLSRWISYYIILFIVLNYCKEQADIYRYVHWLIAVGTVFAIYGILQFAGHDFSFLVQNFIGNATDGNPNFAGQYVTMIFALSLWLTIGSIGRMRMLFYLPCLVLTTFFLFLNKTKGVWVGCAISIMVLTFYIGFLFLTDKLNINLKEEQKKHFKSLLILGGVVGLIAILLLGYASMGRFWAHKPRNSIQYKTGHAVQKVLNEFRQFKTVKLLFKSENEIDRDLIVQGDTTMQRLLIWKNTLKLIKAHPYLGVGLGNYKIAYQPYRTRKEQYSTGPEVFVRRAHNEWLQYWAELGPIGLGAFILIQFTLYFLGHQIIVRSNVFSTQCLALGFMMAFMNIFTTAIFGFALQNPNPSFTVWLLVGLFGAFHWIIWNREKLKEVPARGIDLSFGLKEKLNLSKVKEKIPTLYKGISFFSVSNWVSNKTDQITVSNRVRKILSPLCILLIVWGVVGHYWVWKPATAFYYRQFGQALQRMGLHEKAQIIFERSLKNNPHAWESRFLLANEFSVLGQDEDAIKTHKQSLALNPFHAKGHYNLANVYNKLGEYEKAKQHYSEAVNLDNMLYQGYLNVGAMYFREEDYDKAIEFYKTAIEVKKRFFSAYYNIAYAYAAKKDIPNAIKYVRVARDINPDNQKLIALKKRLDDIMLRQYQQQALEQQLKA